VAGQSVERREMLRIMALAAAASGFPGFHRWAFACGHSGHQAGPVPSAAYTPQFFTLHEYATIEQLTDLMIPAGGGPGAKDAGVSEFVDFMVASDPSLQYPFRFGLGWLDGRCRVLYDKAFLEVGETAQKDTLDHLAYRAKFRPGEEEGRDFFKLIREYTVMGFYTSRAGLEQIDYPGLQVFYATTPSCPHHGDPEHRNLPPPRG
jgi:gluconate 2-dehydrogenase gamma chain